MTLPRIIALAGYKGSGKTAAAVQLNINYYQNISFAKPLKDMLLALGLSRDQLYGTLKETPTPILCGQTPRHAMQTLGTEWRNMIHQDLWTNLWIIKAKERLRHSIDHRVCVDDCRFAHEVETIHNLGGVVWAITRPGCEAPDEHASEDGAAIRLADATIVNDGTLQDLYNKVSTMLLGPS